MLSLYESAAVLADEAHKGQVRVDGTPYIRHPVRVATIIAERVPNASEELISAAILHDVLEDTDVTYEQLVERTNKTVANLVRELTKGDFEGNRESRVYQEAVRLGGISADAQTIKYADIIDNLSDIDKAKPDFASKYRFEKRWQLVKMTDGYQALRQAAWLLAFDKKVIPYHRFIVGG